MFDGAFIPLSHHNICFLSSHDTLQPFKNQRESLFRAPGNELLQIEFKETASEAKGKHLELTGKDVCAGEQCRGVVLRLSQVENNNLLHTPTNLR